MLCDGKAIGVNGMCHKLTVVVGLELSGSEGACEDTGLRETLMRLLAAVPVAAGTRISLQ